MVRMFLAEKGLPCVEIEAKPWDDDGALVAVNPAGTIPVLVDEPPTGGKVSISPATVIIEYLEEAYSKPALMPATTASRAELRRICAWFTNKFETEVNSMIVRERIDRRLMRRGIPDYESLKAGAEALEWHMDYFSWLLDQRTWFAGEKFSTADIAAAGYFSTLDYVDAAPWGKFPIVKDWYARVKSRPSMKPILRDRIDGLPPPRHYNDPDF